MTVFAAGTSLADFTLTLYDTVVITDTTNTAHFDSNVVSSGIFSGYSYLFPTIILSQTTTTFRACWTQYSGSRWQNGNLYVWYDEFGTKIAAIKYDNSYIASFIIYTSGGAGTIVGTIGDIPAIAPGLHRIDVELDWSSTGSVKIYQEGIQVGTTVTGDFLTANPTSTIGQFVVCKAASYSAAMSGILIQDTTTLGKVLAESVPNGAGTYSDLTGSYTDINSVGKDDSTFIYGTVSLDKSTFTTGAFGSSISTGWDLDTLLVSIRAVNGYGSALTNVAAVVRSNTSDSIDTAQATSTGVKTYLFEFPTNPDGSIAWTYTTANAAEIGVQIS